MARRRAASAWAAIGLAAALLATPACDGADARVSPDAQGAGVGVPIYAAGGGEPVAILRAGAVRKDFERRGFFRIGLLPVVVAERVEIEVRDEQAFQGTLKTIQGTLRSFPEGAPLELRRVAVTTPAAAAPVLAADTVRFAADGSWMLAGHVCFSRGARIVHAPRGRLVVAGREAGRLQLEPAPHSIETVELFERTPSIPPQP